MKPLRYILCALVAMSLAGLLQSCVYEFDQKAETAKQSEVMLVLKASLLSGTRASDNDKELMHSLRVVLLDENGYVEFNGHATLGKGMTTVDTEPTEVLGLIKTTAGKKKVYLIANEESVTAAQLDGGSGTQSLSDLFNSVEVGGSNFEEMVNDIRFTPNFENNIVLSSMYEFEINAGNLKQEADYLKATLEFNIVRAATKFDFRLHNKRETPVHIDGMTLSGIANEMYLMAHVNDDFFPKGNMKVPAGKSYTHWIDWMKDVCDETTATPTPEAENSLINEKYGWIVNYEIPATAKHSMQTLVPVNSDDTWNIASGKTLELPTLYYPESKYTNGGSTFQYSFWLKVTDTEEKVDVFKSLEFDGKLDNLCTLFRNTHVIVDITFRYMLDIRIEVLPWVMREQKNLEFGDDYYDGIK